MLLPPGYQDIDTYFHDVLAFLSDYHWLYNAPVTEMLIHNILEIIPPDWAQALLALDYHELNDLPYGLIKECWPQSLQHFCQRCRDLQLPVRGFQGDDVGSHNLTYKLCQGLTPKKRHEVCQLATLIHEECQLKGIFNILDIGSGLGYLGQVLHHHYGYHVLGLESNSQLVEKAVHRQKSLCPTGNAVSYLVCNVSPESGSAIQESLDEQISSIHDLQKCGCQSDKHLGTSLQRVTNDEDLLHPLEGSGCGSTEGLTPQKESTSVCSDTTESVINSTGLCSSTGEITYDDRETQIRVTSGDDLVDNIHKLSNKVVFNTISRTGMSQVCMVGLHTCGDLYASASQLFLKLSSLDLFIVIPCCYHKMTVSNMNPNNLSALPVVWPSTDVKTNPVTERDIKNISIIPESFLHFPQSHNLKKHVAEFPLDFRLFLRRPLLRLASQETCVRWHHCSKKDHEEHSLQLMARAILYLYAHKENLVLRKRRRRGVRKTQLSSFNAILDDMLERYEFVKAGNAVNLDVGLSVRSGLTKLWNEHKSLCALAEVVTGLQVCLQALVESFVLVDKMVYLQENEDHLLSYDVVKVMDDTISPRCHALIARK